MEKPVLITCNQLTIGVSISGHDRVDDLGVSQFGFQVQRRCCLLDALERKEVPGIPGTKNTQNTADRSWEFRIPENPVYPALPQFTKPRPDTARAMSRIVPVEYP